MFALGRRGEPGDEARTGACGRFVHTRTRETGLEGPKGERGAAAVESALVLCFVVLPIVFGVIGFAYMLTFRQSLSQATTEAARAAAVKPVSGDQTARRAAQTAAAKAAIAAAVGTFNGAMACGSAHLECDVTFVDCPEVSASGCIRVAVRYPYRAHSLLPSMPGLGFTLPETLGYSSVAGVS